MDSRKKCLVTTNRCKKVLFLIKSSVRCCPTHPWKTCLLSPDMSKVEKKKKGGETGKRLFGPKTDGWMDAQTAWIGVFGCCLVFGLTEQVIRIAGAHVTAVQHRLRPRRFAFGNRTGTASSSEFKVETSGNAAGCLAAIREITGNPATTWCGIQCRRD